MSITVANTGNTNTFDYWRNRTNELAYAMSTYVVTAGGSNTAAGNAAISGTFTANDLSVANSIFVVLAGIIASLIAKFVYLDKEKEIMTVQEVVSLKL